MSGPVQSIKKKIDDDTTEEDENVADEWLKIPTIRNVKECAAMTEFILVVTFDLWRLAIDWAVLVGLQKESVLHWIRNRLNVPLLHQNKEENGISNPNGWEISRDPKDFLRAKLEGNLEGGEDGALVE